MNMEHNFHIEHEQERINPQLKESKYISTLKKYDTVLDDDKVKAEVEKLLKEHLKENETLEVKKFIFNCIDLTTLKETDNDEYVMKFTQKVNQFDEEFPELKNVAAICVYPCFAEIVKDTLEVEDVNVACVAGGFPSSQTYTEVKIVETALAIKDGADEIDIVLSVGKYLAGDYENLCDEIDEIKETCRDHTLKVILETGALKHASDIKKAAYVMCKAIKEYYEKTGIKKGFKAAGGINTVKDAISYYTIVKEVLGEEWLDNKYFRLGTSRLANLLLSEIVGKEVKFF